jgi:hypothetical protein
MSEGAGPVWARSAFGAGGLWAAMAGSEGEGLPTTNYTAGQAETLMIRRTSP